MNGGRPRAARVAFTSSSTCWADATDVKFWAGARAGRASSRADITTKRIIASVRAGEGRSTHVIIGRGGDNPQTGDFGELLRTELEEQESVRYKPAAPARASASPSLALRACTQNCPITETAAGPGRSGSAAS